MTETIQDAFAITPPPLVYARLCRPLPRILVRPALFLDRDGVINEDTGYLRSVDDLVIRPGISRRIGAARRAGWETVIITNQSGIGRGHYNWTEFEILHAEIAARLKAEDNDAEIGMICACPFHKDALPPHDLADHPWRKPNPGMLLFAAEALGLDLEKSLMIGDSRCDEDAALRAGVSFEYA